jgi:hypothetical protein
MGRFGAEPDGKNSTKSHITRSRTYILWEQRIEKSDAEWLR